MYTLANTNTNPNTNPNPNPSLTPTLCAIVDVAPAAANTIWIMHAFYAPPIRPRLMALYKCALIDWLIDDAKVYNLSLPQEISNCHHFPLF